MNSSVQCLAHTVPVMRTFLGGAYKQQINRTNPLGRAGKLAEAFGGLMDKLWQARACTVTPFSACAAASSAVMSSAAVPQKLSLKSSFWRQGAVRVCHHDPGMSSSGLEMQHRSTLINDLC